MNNQVERKSLQPALIQRARRAYQALYMRAMPHAGRLPLERIEVATFNRATTWQEFERVGLGLEVVSIHRTADGSGHTGKVLMNLPGQLLPEHQHVDTWVLKRGVSLPNGFKPLRELVRDFRGIVRYAPDGSVMTRNGKTVYAYTDRAYQIVQSKTGRANWPADRHADVVATFPGKSETFKAIYGDGVLLHRGAQVLFAPKGVRPDRVPDRFLSKIERVRAEEVITTEETIYMAPGVIVLLDRCTPHAFLAGSRGAVYLEFSTPSMDEADRFTDPRIIR